MKNTIKVLGIIALAAIIGFSFAACGGGDDGGNNPGSNNPGDSKGWITVTNQPFYFDDSNILNGSSSLTLSSIQTIAYGNGKFIAGGDYIEGASTISQMASSSDGINWTAATHSFDRCWNNRIAFGNGMFVIVGTPLNGYPKIAYSTDGATWTFVPDVEKLFAYYPLPNSNPDYTLNSGIINRILYGGGKFIAVGSNTHPQNSTTVRYSKTATSSDGVTWTAAQAVFTLFSPPNISAAAYGNGKFVAVDSYGYSAYSTDGITWTDVPYTANPFRSGIDTIVYGNNKFLGVQSKVNIVEYSSNGEAWTEEKNSTLWTAIKTTYYGTGTINAIAYGNGKFVAGSSWGRMAYLSDN